MVPIFLRLITVSFGNENRSYKKGNQFIFPTPRITLLVKTVTAPFPPKTKNKTRELIKILTIIAVESDTLNTNRVTVL